MTWAPRGRKLGERSLDRGADEVTGAGKTDDVIALILEELDFLAIGGGAACSGSLYSAYKRT
ncbi:hypothetical protein SATRM34S_00648 [Streptomyces atroolivaceus]